MIDFGNLTYRNIQEQVAKNASDISDLDSKIDETKQEITGGSPYTIQMLYQQNVGQDNSIYLLQTGKQDKLTAGAGISIDSDNVISATASGTTLYRHTFSGITASHDVVTHCIDADGTPITSSNFIDRMHGALFIQSSSRNPFIAGFAYQSGDTSCQMAWLSSATSLVSDLISFGGVIDVITEL